MRKYFCLFLLFTTIVAHSQNIEWVVKPVYDNLKQKQDNYLIVQRDKFYGIISYKGEEIIPLKFENIGYMNAEKSLIPAQLNSKWGYISLSGETVIPFQFDDAETFSNNYAGVKKGKLWGFIDQNGKKTIDFKYDNVGKFDKNLQAEVSLNGKYWHINPQNESVEPIRYVDIGTYNNDDDNGYKFSQDGKWGLKKGNEIILKPKYDYISNLSDGLYEVRLDKKWGWINELGVEVIAPMFDAKGFSVDNLLPVKYNGKWGIIINPKA
jgi:hypothetical protein